MDAYERFNEPFEKWAKTAMGWELKKIKTPVFLLDTFVVIPVFGKEEAEKSEISLLTATDFSEESDLDLKGMKHIRVVGFRLKVSPDDKGKSAEGESAVGESTVVEVETEIVEEGKGTEAETEMVGITGFGDGNDLGSESTEKPRRRDKEKERKNKNAEAQQRHRSSSRSTSRSSSRVADETNQFNDNASESSESFPSLSHLLNSGVTASSPAVDDASFSKPEERVIHKVRRAATQKEHEDSAVYKSSAPNVSGDSLEPFSPKKRKFDESAEVRASIASSGEESLPDLLFAKSKREKVGDYSAEELRRLKELERRLDLSLLPKCSVETEPPLKKTPKKRKKKSKTLVPKGSFTPRRVPPRRRNWKPSTSEHSFGAVNALNEKKKFEQMKRKEKEHERRARQKKVHKSRQKDKKKKIRQVSKLLADTGPSGTTELDNSEPHSSSSAEDSREANDEEVQSAFEDILATLYRPGQDDLDLDLYRGRQVLDYRRRYKLPLRYRLGVVKKYRSQLIAQSITKTAMQIRRIRSKRGRKFQQEINRRCEKGQMDPEAPAIFGDHIANIKKQLANDDGAPLASDTSFDASKSFSDKLKGLEESDLLYLFAKEVTERDRVLGNKVARTKRAGFIKKKQSEKTLDWQRLTAERLLHTVRIRSDLNLIPAMVGEDPAKYESVDDQRDLVQKKVGTALHIKEQARKSFFSVFNGIKKDVETWKGKIDEKEKECKETEEEFDDYHVEEIIRGDLLGERSHRNPNWKEGGAVSHLEDELCDMDFAAPLGTEMDAAVKHCIVNANGSDIPNQSFDDKNADSPCLTPMPKDCGSWLSDSSKMQQTAKRKLQMKLPEYDFKSPCSSKKRRDVIENDATPSPGNSPLPQFSHSQSHSAVFSSPDSVKLAKMPSIESIHAPEFDNEILSQEPMEHSTPIGPGPKRFHEETSPVSAVIAADADLSPVRATNSTPAGHNVLETPFKTPIVPCGDKIKLSTPTEKDEQTTRKWIKCTAECDAQIPELWASHLFSLLEPLIIKYKDMMDLQERVFLLSTCQSCIVGQYPYCGLDKDDLCLDAVKQLRKVQLHCSGVRNFIRRIYRLRQINNWMLQLDRILDSGSFADLLKHIDLSESRRLELSFERAALPAETRRALLEAQKEAAARRVSSIAHVPTIREKWGKLIKNFNTAIEYPQEVCDICHQWVYKVKELKEKTNENDETISALQQLPTSKEELRDYFRNRLGSAKTIRVCKNCPKHKVSSSCWFYLNHKTSPRLPPLAVENGMEIDEITEMEGGQEFGDLNVLEEMFVKQMTAFLTVVRLKPQSSSMRNGRMYRALKGHGINLPLPFAENLELISKTMPNLKFLTVLVDGVSDADKKIWRSLVRIDKVLKLLKLYKAENHLYADIDVLDSDAPELQKMLNEVFKETPPELLSGDGDFVEPGADTHIDPGCDGLQNGLHRASASENEQDMGSRLGFAAELNLNSGCPSGACQSGTPNNGAQNELHAADIPEKDPDAVSGIALVEDLEEQNIDSGYPSGARQSGTPNNGAQNELHAAAIPEKDPAAVSGFGLVERLTEQNINSGYPSGAGQSGTPNNGGQNELHATSIPESDPVAGSGIGLVEDLVEQKNDSGYPSGARQSGTPYNGTNLGKVGSLSHLAQKYATNKDPVDVPKKNAAIPSIRQYTAAEKVNIQVEQYSITALQSSQPAEKDTELYRKVRVIAEPVADKEPYKEEKIFPVIYPRGLNGLQEDPDPMKKRPSPLKPHQFLRGRFNNIRGKRFRRDPQWLFYHQNERTKKDINNGVYATMNLSKKPQNMTVRQFLNGIRTGKMESAIANMFGSIKGTKEYWQRRRNELTSLEETYGPPTWYLTLSCAEYIWEDMANYLRQRNPDLNSESIVKLLQEDPTGIAQQFKRRVEAVFDKIINAKGQGGIGPLGKVVHFFWRYEYQARGAPHIHCLIWVENAPILKEDMSNKSEVVEFINNHVSCCLPDENDDDNCELRRLVERFQKHSCTGSCTRTAKTQRGRKHVFCRYHFPRPCRTSTEMRSVKASVKSRMGVRKGKKLYELERTEHEQYINDYNPTLLLAWKANMDLQYVGDESMVLVKYVTGYVGKHDKGTTGPVWDVANRDPNIRKSLWQYGCDIFRHREIGAIEAADRLLGHALYKFSPGDSPKFLNTKSPEDKFRRLKKMTEAEGIEEQDNPEAFKDLFNKVFEEDYYPARPESWENVPMAVVHADWDFNNKDPLESQENVTAKDYPWRDVAIDKDKDFVGMYGGSGESDHEEDDRGENLFADQADENLEPNDPGDDDSPEEPNEAEPLSGQEKKRGRKGSKYVVLKDKDGNYLGRLVQRKKKCVTITSHYKSKCSSPEHVENQYRVLLLLYKPWRSLDDLKATYSTYESAWKAWADENPNGYWSADMAAKKRVEKVDELIEKYQMEVDAEEQEQQEAQENPVEAQEDAADIPVSTTYKDPYEMNDMDLENAISGLNKGQRRVFDKIIYSIHHKEHCMKTNSCSCPHPSFADETPLRCTVTGVGGTGKSHLIKVISAKLIKEYGKDKDGNSQMAVARIAPTGIAGLNINGKTIHKLLRINPKNNRLQCEKLDKHRGLKVMQGLLENVKLFIVDEYSMVSNVLLNLINDRLNEAFPRSQGQHHFKTPIKELCFGRRNLALFGDILQLKPVNAKYCFEPLTASDTDKAGGGLGIETRLMDQFSYDELEENMRQRGDPEFQEMLARIRLGNLTEDDVKRLKNCEKEFSTYKEMAEYLLQLMSDDPNCLALVPTLDKMDKLNEAMLEVKGFKPIDIPAWEELRQKAVKKTKRKMGKFRVGSATWKAAQSSGLSHNLRIAQGAQVMLRKNLDDDPQVGLVNGAIGTVVRIIESSDRVVQKIVVRFHRTGKEHEIKRVRADYEISQGNYQTLRQFPLCLSYAITIHRCQGVTLESAMIDLTSDGVNGIFEDAQAYVSLSRVKSFKNVHLIAFGKHAIRADVVAIKEYSRLRRNAGLHPVDSFNDRPAEYRGVGKRFARGETEIRVPVHLSKHAKAGKEKQESNGIVSAGETTKFMLMEENLNHCYANSLVQGLLGLELLKQQLEAQRELLQQTETKEDKLSPSSQQLLSIFADLQAAKECSSTAALATEVFGNESVEEQAILDLWNMMFLQFPKTAQSLFEFRLVTQITCNNDCCPGSTEADKDVPANVLSLHPINGTMKWAELLDKFSEKAALPESKCSVCGEIRYRSDSISFPKSMKYLFVFLGLFETTDRRLNSRKIKDFKNYDVRINGAKFQTAAAITHKGDRAGSGHFTCLRKSMNNGKPGWRKLVDAGWEDPRRDNLGCFVNNLENIALLILRRVF